MMRFGQFVEREHSDDRGERGGKNRQFKRDGNEHRPTVERASADVHRITHDVRIPFHEITAESAANSGDQNDQRHEGFFLAEILRQAFHGKGRERVHFSEAVFVGGFRGDEDFFVVGKFRHQAVNVFVRVHDNFPSRFSATILRVSEMAIIGKKRTNKIISVKNNPTLPASVAQSQNVGRYIPQADGVKSRCKLTTTMTKRSTHIPALMPSATKNSASGCVRTRRIQSSCGIKTLRSISAQKIQPYGPNARLAIMYCSKISPLYHDMNASMT